MKEQIVTGPLAWFFTNVNTDMKLPGHSHYAEVTFFWKTTGTRGFPAFAETYTFIQDILVDLGRLPFRDATNEEVLRRLWSHFTGLMWFTIPQFQKWGGEFHLVKMELAVRGVPDKIGHADGFTRYQIEKEGA